MLALWFIEGERNEGIKGNMQEDGRRGSEGGDEGGREEREKGGPESLRVTAHRSSVSYSEWENGAGVFRALPFVSCELQSVLCQNMEEVEFLCVVSSPGPVTLLWLL